MIQYVFREPIPRGTDYTPKDLPQHQPRNTAYEDVSKINSRTTAAHTIKIEEQNHFTSNKESIVSYTCSIHEFPHKNITHKYIIKNTTHNPQQTSSSKTGICRELGYVQGVGCTKCVDKGVGCTKCVDKGAGCTKCVDKGVGCTKCVDKGVGCTKCVDKGVGCTKCVDKGPASPLRTLACAAGRRGTGWGAPLVFVMLCDHTCFALTWAWTGISWLWAHLSCSLVECSLEVFRNIGEIYFQDLALFWIIFPELAFGLRWWTKTPENKTTLLK